MPEKNAAKCMVVPTKYSLVQQSMHLCLIQKLPCCRDHAPCLPCWSVTSLCYGNKWNHVKNTFMVYVQMRSRYVGILCSHPKGRCARFMGYACVMSSCARRAVRSRAKGRNSPLESDPCTFPTTYSAYRSAKISRYRRGTMASRVHYAKIDGGDSLFGLCYVSNAYHHW